MPVTETILTRKSKLTSLELDHMDSIYLLTWHIVFRVIPTENAHSKPNHKETFSKPNLRDILQNNYYELIKMSKS